MMISTRSIGRCLVKGFHLNLNFCKVYVNSKKLCTLIPGFATKDGTELYITTSKLKLHHRFKRSQLCVGPVVHGPPTRIIPAQEEMQLLAHALINNGSNCAFVYDHSSGTYATRQFNTADKRLAQEPFDWYQRGLSNVLQACNISRDQFVAIAGLGHVPSPHMLKSEGDSTTLSTSDILTERLVNACNFSGLNRIDYAILEIGDLDFIDGDIPELNEALSWLKSAVDANLLQGYGVLCDVRPYTFHTPPQATSGSLAMYPSIIETRLANESTNCEFVAYSISPTSAMPHTYPMLPASLDQYNPTEYAHEGLIETDILSRSLSRISVDGFLARRGRGLLDEEEDALSVSEKNAKFLGQNVVNPDEKIHEGSPFPLVSAVPGMHSETAEYMCQVLDELCPHLQTTPRLQDKTLRVILSIGIDCVIADADLAPILGKHGVLPEHILHHEDTDDVFGVFMLPEELTK